MTDALGRILQMQIDAARQERDLAQRQLHLMQAAMLDGSECVLFGRRARITVEWLEGPAMRPEQLAAYAAGMRRLAAE